MLLRTSERISFKTCRQQWWWSYVERLAPQYVAPALRFGDLIHRALKVYYKPGRKRGQHPARALEKIYEEVVGAGFYLRDEDGNWEEALGLGVDMLEHYVDHWAGDPDWEVMWSEAPGSVDVYGKNGKYLVTYVFQLDICIRDRSKGQLGLVETKTATTISDAHLGLDEQAGSYWAFAPQWLRELGVLKPGNDIDFILYNFLRKAKRDNRPRDQAGRYLNKDGSISKKQPPAYFKRVRTYRTERDRENLIQRVRMEAWEMAKVKAGELPVYKNPRLTYPDQHCNSCGFRDMCELHETSGDWKEYRDAMMDTWDPYEAHDDPIL